MRRDQRQRQVLGALLVILVGVAAYRFWPSAPDASQAAIGTRGAPRTGKAPLSEAVADVHLEELESARPRPEGGDRNLFKFKPKPPPPAPKPAPVVVVEAPSGPPPPPPLPPISLKFIGVVQAERADRIAILSDGRGAPIYGKEGDTVLGQYKILRIGAESIEMTYLDGRGRQTIRLSGS